ncbi:MAG TPA: gamma-glutamyltransferase, partial [Myxococcaceae bacterium]|nr:gamma-glutamyltransferase [Myxococcaceae bacterium]
MALRRPFTVRPLAQALASLANLYAALSFAQAPPAVDPSRIQSQTRSMVMSRFGVVVTSQTLASSAGAQILEAGGNAVDAAIAANAVLGVVEPMSNGLGGDLLAIIYEAKTGKLHGLNASGWAPANLTAELVRSKGYARMPQTGALSVTVPGVVAGWEALRKKLGTQSLATLLRPAIHYAEEGFPVTELIAATWKSTSAIPDPHPNLKSTYLPDGRAPQIGEIFRNPDLARSLRSIASKGRSGFYKGSIAAAMVQLLRDAGGVLELSDLAEYEAEWVEPVSTTYHGWTVAELPLNGQGIAALLMLNLMERFPLAQFGHNSAKALHAMIEAKKLAYADMLRRVADPRFALGSVEDTLIEKMFAVARASEIHLNRARSSISPASADDLKVSLATDTVYLAVVDKDGNMVSLIQSLYGAFGSGLVAPGTGFALQN